MLLFQLTMQKMVIMIKKMKFQEQNVIAMVLFPEMNSLRQGYAFQTVQGQEPRMWSLNVWKGLLTVSAKMKNSHKLSRVLASSLSSEIIFLIISQRTHEDSSHEGQHQITVLSVDPILCPCLDGSVLFSGINCFLHI